MKPILIACCSSKISTTKPVMAKDLYTGELFLKTLNAAIRLSDQVFIVSAGMGLLNLADLVMPYDIKMTPSRALWFRRNKIVEVEEFSHFLPKTYLDSVIGNGKTLFSSSGLGIGQQMEEAYKLAEGKTPLIDLDSLAPLTEKLILNTGEIKQEHRTGPSKNICQFIGDLFENETLSLEEASLRCEMQFGPPCGLSYKPTVSRQLRVQADKRGKKIKTEPIEGFRTLRYSYI